MKRIKQIIFPATLCTVLLASCGKDFLEIKPKGSFIPETTEEYSLMFSSNSLLSERHSTSAIFMGDEVGTFANYISSATVREQRLFAYEAEIYNPTEEQEEMKQMGNAYVFNKIINEVMQSTGGSEISKRALWAEAKANRAITYFHLVNFFGKPYNPASAASDLSIPIVQEANINGKQFQRATVKAVYDFIVQDLTEAIPHLPVDQTVRYRLCKAAAEAVLGKVYVFMRRFDEAIPQFNNALNHLPQSFKVELYDYNQTLAPGGEWKYVAATPLTIISEGPINGSYKEYLVDRKISSPILTNSFLLTPAAFALFTNASDKRILLFSQYPYGNSTPFPLAGFRRRLGPTNTVANTISLPEVYLLRAECAARGGDLDGAATDLEALRKKRMNDADAEVNIADQEAMIRFIIEERTREFPLSGLRWYDMRRLSVDPLFAAQTYQHQVVNADGSVKNTYTLKPERMTLRFAPSVIDQNPGMPNNP